MLRSFMGRIDALPQYDKPKHNTFYTPYVMTAEQEKFVRGLSSFSSESNSPNVESANEKTNEINQKK